MNAENLYKVLKTLSFDDDKNNMLRNMIDSIKSIDDEYLVKILSVYSFDEKKNQALSILKNRIRNLSSQTIITIMGLFSFDRNKLDALTTITTEITNIDPSIYDKIINTFSFDKNKIKATMILVNQQSLISQIGEQTTTTRIDLSKFAESFSDRDKFLKAGQILGYSVEELEEHVENNFNNNSSMNINFVDDTLYINGNTIYISSGTEMNINGTIIKKDKRGNLSVNSFF